MSVDQHADSPRSSPTLPCVPRERQLGFAFALVAAFAVALGVTPELRIDCPDLNDSAYHVAIAIRMHEALDRGESPIDFWYSDIGMGFPLLRHYQHLPHLCVVLLHRLAANSVPIPVIYRALLGALLVSFPLSLYAGLRRFGLRPLACGAAALLAPLVSTPHLYGFGFESYLWGGSGLFAQLFAAVLMPLAFGEAYRAASASRGLSRAAVLIAATFVSQLVYGYMLVVSTLAFIIPGPNRFRRLLRVALLLAVTAAAGSYFFVPALQDAEFANHSVWEAREKWDSLGARKVLAHLVTGHLFDHELTPPSNDAKFPIRRMWLPVITALLGIGLLHALLRGDTGERILTGLFVAWLLLFFGRTTWGRLIDYLPLSADIPLHRFVGSVHFFGLALAGSGLALVLRALTARCKAVADPSCDRQRAAPVGYPGMRLIVAVVVLAILLTPAVLERIRYLAQSRAWKQQAAHALALTPRLADLRAHLAALNDGRAYVGMPNRKDEYLKVGAIPLSALCLLDGVDTLGFLWIAITYAGDVQLHFDPRDESHCRTFGVRYLLLGAQHSPPGFARSVEHYGRFTLYEVPDVSYFGLAEVPFAVSCTKRTVYSVGAAWLRSILPRWQIHPALDVDGRAPADLPRVRLDANDPVGSLTCAGELPVLPNGEVRQLDAWSCEVAVDGPAALIRRGTYHPGLRATLDGRAVTPFPVAPGFAAIRLPPGTHAVRFTYHAAPREPWYLLGLAAVLLAAPLARRYVPSFDAPPRRRCGLERRPGDPPAAREHHAQAPSDVGQSADPDPDNRPA